MAAGKMRASYFAIQHRCGKRMNAGFRNQNHQPRIVASKTTDACSAHCQPIGQCLCGFCPIEMSANHEDIHQMATKQEPIVAMG